MKYVISQLKPPRSQQRVKRSKTVPAGMGRTLCVEGNYNALSESTANFPNGYTSQEKKNVVVEQVQWPRNILLTTDKEGKRPITTTP